QIRLRLHARHARLQARHHVEIVPVTIIKTVAVSDGNPEFSVSRQVKQIRDVWNHADHRKTFAVKSDRLADDLRIRVEAPPPQSFGHNHREDFVRMIFFRQQQTAEYWLNPKQREKRGRHYRSINPLRLSIAG